MFGENKQRSAAPRIIVKEGKTNKRIAPQIKRQSMMVKTMIMMMNMKMIVMMIIMMMIIRMIVIIMNYYEIDNE